MAGTEIPTLSDELRAELEKLAKAQSRPIEEVLADAVQRYVHDAQWADLHAYGRQKVKEKGLKPSDVERLIAESRSEQSR